ncbi:MAG: 16S rRNA (cytosine(1402)-N(4))-methyltransferase RsmH [Clostridia bacterium]|nr:16S rRNA (cytosine(1402)-N(4))-methyltransferase RsmH [Clostridia bacterium]
MEFNHIPVILNETIEGLNVKADGIYVDGTLGGAGHSSEICKKLNELGTLIGIDQDEEALAFSQKVLENFDNKVVLIHDNYKNVKNVLKKLAIEKVDGILLDIGVSSYQIDNAERGFSYMKDADLDMRMDRSKGITAADVVNTYSEGDIANILFKYGEESYAKKIASRIVEERKNREIKTTFELVRIIESAVPGKYKAEGHVAKKTFQAIRIEVNKELEVLENTIDDMIDLLNPGGRLCIITFHSLEDRIVKEKFKTAENPCICPRDLPICMCGRKSKGKVITKKPIIASSEEMAMNSRARSAKLRVFEKN